MRLLAFLGLIFIATLARADDLRVDDAWIREAPPGASVHAGFARLHNDGARDLAIVGVECEAFSSAQLHEMSMDDGVMRMRPLERVTIAAGADHVFAPGEQHLMLFNAKRPLKAGDQVTVALVLDDGQRIEVAFDVRRPR